MFKCECGKEFEKPNSFNAHKSHCKVHYLAKYGNLDNFTERHNTTLKAAKSGNDSYSAACTAAKQTKLLHWIEEKHICEKCGKVMTEKYGSGRFCSKTCASSHKCSDSTKIKISKALTKCEQKTCKYCNCLIDHRNKVGMCISCLKTTTEGKQVLTAKGKIGYQTTLALGKFIGWKTRNIRSFPEQFFEKVLLNNNIDFECEVPVQNNNGSYYFLDFLIKVGDLLIDLEVDGAQHLKPERHLHDVARDEFLSSTYEVYRIAWNEINSEAGKQQMKDKINKFLDFYNSLLN